MGNSTRNGRCVAIGSREQVPGHGGQSAGNEDVTARPDGCAKPSVRSRKSLHFESLNLSGRIEDRVVARPLPCNHVNPPPRVDQQDAILRHFGKRLTRLPPPWPDATKDDQVQVVAPAHGVDVLSVTDDVRLVEAPTTAPTASSLLVPGTVGNEFCFKSHLGRRTVSDLGGWNLRCNHGLATRQP